MSHFPVLIGLFTMLPLVSIAQTHQDIAFKVIASTVSIVMQDGDGKTISVGSGFFVRPGYVATNLDVIAGASHGAVRVFGFSTLFDIEGVAAVDRNRHLVILKLSRAPDVPILALRHSGLVHLGEPIIAIGGELGSEGLFTYGEVSQIRNVRADKLLILTMHMSPSTNGGPIFDPMGRVIGVSVIAIRGGELHHVAIPSEHLRHLIANISSVRPLPITVDETNPWSVLSALESP
jgi:serine protease Do